MCYSRSRRELFQTDPCNTFHSHPLDHQRNIAETLSKRQRTMACGHGSIHCRNLGAATSTLQLDGTNRRKIGAVTFILESYDEEWNLPEQKTRLEEHLGIPELSGHQTMWSDRRCVPNLPLEPSNCSGASFIVLMMDLGMVQ